jgi:hypothetical protein
VIEAFATALGIPACDIAAVTGIPLPTPPEPDDPPVREMAGLLWACRRLTAAQVEKARRQGEAMHVPVPEHATSEHWNRVHHHHGTGWGAPDVERCQSRPGAPQQASVSRWVCLCVLPLLWEVPLWCEELLLW